MLVHNGKTGDELLVILKNIDEGRKQAPLLPKDPYQKVRACFWAKLGDKKVVLSSFSSLETALRKALQFATCEFVLE